MKTPAPFDLAKAMAGEPLVCRDPRYKPTFATYNPDAGVFPLGIWLIKPTGSVLDVFTANGTYRPEGSTKSSYDLFMAPTTTTRTMWVNIYQCGTRPFPIGLYETEEQAREMARLNPEGYLGTDSVTWEE